MRESFVAPLLQFAKRSALMISVSIRLGVALTGGAFLLNAATPACDNGNGGLTLPAGFCALVVADGLGPARHAVVAPNGDLYVALQGGLLTPGGVVALRD